MLFCSYVDVAVIILMGLKESRCGQISPSIHEMEIVDLWCLSFASRPSLFIKMFLSCFLAQVPSQEACGEQNS